MHEPVAPDHDKPSTLESLRASNERLEREVQEARSILTNRTRELTQQREWYEVTLQSIGDAVITTDSQSHVTFLNPVAEKLTGWLQKEANGRPLAEIFNIINEDSRQPAENPVHKVLKTGAIQGLANHTALISRDGTEISIEDSAAPIRDHRGNFAGAIMVFHDVTVQRRAERALRASEARMRAIFRHTAIGIALADQSGRFEECNPAICEILGYSADELRHRAFFDLSHPEDQPAVQEKVRQLLQGATDHFALEHRHIRKDGQVIWGNSTVTVLRRDDGGPAQFIVIVENVTERRKNAETRARLAAVVESSDDAIITKNLDGIITSWNPGAKIVFGYDAHETIGKSVTMLIPPDQQDEEPQILARLRRGEKIDHYETRRRRKDGTIITVSLSVSPLKDADGRIIGASKIARDITRNARLYEAAQREIERRELAEAELREGDRRKDEFLATLAHELRNPLAPIRQAALISTSPGASDSQRRWSHEVIARQVRNMSLLLEDLLDISRVTRGTLSLRTEATDLLSIIEVAVETARPLIDDRRHELSIDLPAETVGFVADPLRLSQVVSNLLTNAAKYTDPGGKIALTARADAREVAISVADNGIGIPPAALPNIFKMFSQLADAKNRAQGGLGIGLALAKGLIDLHRGSLTAESAGPGRGSRFTVTIPRIGAEATPGRDDPESNLAFSGVGARRVVIADDNRDAADSLAMLVGIEGHGVTVVHDGAAAIDAIRRLKPDVAILDIGMPRLDGYEVARQVRADPSLPRVKLVALTGWGHEQDRARAMEAGFDMHMTKPVEPQHIIELLG
jgi:PAS domain S-box-containing protein